MEIISSSLPWGREHESNTAVRMWGEQRDGKGAERRRGEEKLASKVSVKNQAKGQLTPSVPPTLVMMTIVV